MDAERLARPGAAATPPSSPAPATTRATTAWTPTRRRTTVYVDYSPVINGGLQLSADPVNRGDNLTLTAVNVTDHDGTVDEVDFYRDANGNGVLDPTVDEFLGTAPTAAATGRLTVSTSG